MWVRILLLSLKKLKFLAFLTNVPTKLKFQIKNLFSTTMRNTFSYGLGKFVKVFSFNIYLRINQWQSFSLQGFKKLSRTLVRNVCPSKIISVSNVRSSNSVNIINVHPTKSVSASNICSGKPFQRNNVCPSKPICRNVCKINPTNVNILLCKPVFTDLIYHFNSSLLSQQLLYFLYFPFHLNIFSL